MTLFMSFEWLLYCFKMFLEGLPDDFCMTFWWIPDVILNWCWWLPDDCRMNPKWLQDDFRMTSGWLPDDFYEWFKNNVQFVNVPWVMRWLNWDSTSPSLDSSTILGIGTCLTTFKLSSKLLHFSSFRAISEFSQALLKNVKAGK